MKSNTGKIAEIFSALKNPTRFGLIMGVITKDLPEIEIDIGNGILLTKESLLFSAGILKDYEREYKITSTDVQIKGDKLNSDGSQLDQSGTKFNFTAAPAVIMDTTPTSSRPVVSIPEGVATLWSTSATTFTAKAKNFDLNGTDFKSTGTIELTDQIKKDDKVMLMATETNQLFYVIDKVISFQ